MTTEEITEGNELIAKYMGVTWYSDIRNGSYYVGNVPHVFPTSLGYHASWDWMWPVIDKINGLGKEYSFATFKTYASCTVEKGGKVFKDFSFAHAEYITATQTSKEAVYRLLVKFVKWYNTINIEKDLVVSK